MCKLARFIIIFFCGFCPLNAEVVVEAKAKLTQDSNQGPSFLIEGNTSLPDNTVLVISLFFSGERVPWSWQEIRVKDGKFRYRYGPLKAKILAGTYHYKVSYHNFRQYPNMKPLLLSVNDFDNTYSFYTGDPLQELKEEEEFTKSIENLKTEFQLLYSNLISFEKTLDTVPDKEKAEVAKNWMQEWQKSHQNLDNSLTHLSYPYVLVPRYPESIYDLQTISVCSDFLYRWRLQAIGERFGFSTPSERILVQHPALAIRPSEYIAEIERRFQAISGREQIFREINGNALHIDLGRINQFYTKLREAFEKVNAGQMNPSDWSAWIVTWIKGIESVKSRIVIYKDSKLSQNYPNIISDLQEMHDILQNLANYYNEIITKGLKIQENDKEKEWISALQKKYLSLYQIVLNERETQHKERCQIALKLASYTKELLDLKQELEKSYNSLKDQEKWKTWASDWRNRLDEKIKYFEGYEKDETIYRNFPLLGHYLRTSVFCLRALFQEYRDKIQGINSSNYDERVEYFETTWNQVISKIQTELSLYQNGEKKEK